MTPEQVATHRADRRKLLEDWQARGTPDTPFPFGAFEELKRQEQEAREALTKLAGDWKVVSGTPDRGGHDPARLAELRGRYAAVWRTYRRLNRDVRTAVRLLRTAPPMTVPGLRWVFAEDDLRQVAEEALPPAGSPEWTGYQST